MPDGERRTSTGTPQRRRSTPSIAHALSPPIRGSWGRFERGVGRTPLGPVSCVSLAARGGPVGGVGARASPVAVCRHGLIRESVRLVLQELIEAEAAEVISARRYERTEGHTTDRSGHRPRGCTTKAGDVQLAIPKLRAGPARRRRAGRVAGRRRREVLGLDVGDSEDEVFWRAFLTGLTKQPGRGAAGHLRPACRPCRRSRASVPGVTHQRCRVHFACNLLAHVPQVRSRWPRRGTGSGTISPPDSPRSGRRWTTAKRGFWRSPRSAGPLASAVIRPISALLSGTHDEWQTDERRYLSEASMAHLYPDGTPTSDTDTSAITSGTSAPRTTSKPTTQRGAVPGGVRVQ